MLKLYSYLHVGAEKYEYLYNMNNQLHVVGPFLRRRQLRRYSSFMYNSYYTIMKLVLICLFQETITSTYKE
jgi:hypothetical protein